MARVLVVVGLLLAVALPTALLTEGSASARRTTRPKVYTVSQVLRAFRSEGIELVRQPVEVKFGYQELATADQNVSVNVYPATRSSYTELYAYDTSGKAPPPPKFSSTGNLLLAWEPRLSARVRRALDRMSLTTAVTAFGGSPTFVLVPGKSRTIDVRSNAQVDCVRGSDDEAETAADITSIESGSDSEGTVTLRWTRPTSRTIAFSCS